MVSHGIGFLHEGLGAQEQVWLLFLFYYYYESYYYGALYYDILVVNNHDEDARDGLARHRIPARGAGRPGAGIPTNTTAAATTSTTTTTIS